jgi:hypothetical protein
LIKQHAEKQKIKIELTAEQAEALLAGWDDKDPRLPAQITFYAKDRPVAELRVAGYRYRGDTCCV